MPEHKNIPYISIIVPVHNVEEYLPRCLGALCSQTLQNIEIICVDDGSTDCSWQVVESFARRDGRVVALKQSHQGVGEARNKGIRAAKGAYIGFVDSDDYVRETMFERLWDAAKKDGSDMVFCNCELVYSDQPEEEPALASFCTEKHTGVVACSPELLSTLPTHIWTRIIKTSTLRKANVFFPKGCWYEDLCFHYLLYPHCKSASFIEDRLYYYRQRSGSIMNKTRTCKPTKVIDRITIVFNIFDDWKKNGFIERYRIQFIQIFLSSLKFFRNMAPHDLQRTVIQQAVSFFHKHDIYLGSRDDMIINKMLNRKEIKELNRIKMGKTSLPASYYWHDYRRRFFGVKKDIFHSKV